MSGITELLASERSERRELITTPERVVWQDYSLNPGYGVSGRTPSSTKSAWPNWVALLLNHEGLLALCVAVPVLLLGGLKDLYRELHRPRK